MKKILVAAAMTLGLSQGAVAQDAESVSALTAQGKVLLASHYSDVTDIVIMVVGTVEGGPEYICRTRFRGGSGYDECRKMD